MDTGRAWIAGLPAELGAQRRILSGLREHCELDDDIRWFALSCSLARGAGDRLSDVDAGLGVAQDRVTAVCERVAALDLGPRVETLAQDWPGARPMRRLFIQFTDDTQLDLVVMPARGRPGRAPDEVVLYDPDAALAEEFTPGVDVVDGGTVREWTFLALVALADLAKYLDRGSLWEAHARLHEVRDRIWALWAAHRGARYPAYGLSQVLDHDPADLPPGIDSTVAGLDDAALRTAARESARLLREVAALAAARYPTELPDSLASYVNDRLNGATSHGDAR